VSGLPGPCNWNTYASACQIPASRTPFPISRLLDQLRPYWVVVDVCQFLFMLPRSLDWEVVVFSLPERCGFLHAPCILRKISMKGLLCPIRRFPLPALQKFWQRTLPLKLQQAMHVIRHQHKSTACHSVGRQLLRQSTEHYFADKLMRHQLPSLVTGKCDEMNVVFVFEYARRLAHPRSVNVRPLSLQA